MSSVLLINGSPNQYGCTYTALCEVQGVLEKRGVKTQLIWVGHQPVAGCIACGIAGSPVYYAATSGQITCFLNRLFYAGGSRMAGKLGAAVVSCRRGGAASAFDQLNKYFTISNMPVVSSQYWNQVHGNTPEEVRQDEEGLQIMRTLGENMAWMLQNIQAGRASGVGSPVYEPRIGTNFIR